MRFANNCLIPPNSMPAVLCCVFLLPAPGERAGSSGPTAAGKAAGCAFISPNPSFKCSLHLTALQSWISPQRAEEVCCAGRGMLVTKPDTRRQVTMSCRLFLAGIRGSRGLPGGQLAVLLVVTCPVVVAGDFLHGVSSSVGCSGCRAWHGRAADGNRAGVR